jgi:hypothetical protein
MADKKDQGIGETINRVKDLITQEVEQHKDEDVDLDDLEDVSGGWKIYYTDPAPTPTPTPITPDET